MDENTKNCKKLLRFGKYYTLWVILFSHFIFPQIAYNPEADKKGEYSAEDIQAIKEDKNLLIHDKNLMDMVTQKFNHEPKEMEYWDAFRLVLE